MIAPPLKSFNSVVITFIILIGYSVESTQYTEYAANNSDYDCPYAECDAAEAEHCFDEVYNNILCHVGSKQQRKGCDSSDTLHFCSSLEVALNCTSNVIDCNCAGEGQGRDVYDSWLHGLMAVKDSLCGDNLDMINNLIDSPNCWNPQKFISCTARTSGVAHVKDLLSTRLSRIECNAIISAVSTCNAQVEKQKCKGTADAVTHALQVFFQASPCGDACSLAAKTSAVVAESTSSGVTIGLTVMVMMLVGVATVLLLMKFRILTLGLNITRGEDDDEHLDPEEHERY
ncbi:unnamed protein product [Meganyctiphanes norvegica]|uniref:Uncharacterized protein n=1 Tax=Meganyctiphanes norvegica TaxID=48144 RepID=A0AAV2SD40_MEGNR